MKKIWFSSDLHFGHKNIIKYCNRPWDNVEDMNQGILDNWNSVVSPNDDVYILGDVCMGKLNENIPLVSKLNGNKYLVAGNHDVKAKTIPEFQKCFRWIKDYYELFIKEEKKKQLLVMSHFPMMVWHKNHRGSFMLCAHSHGSLKQTLPEYNGAGKILDVGLDVHNYHPISYEKVKEIMAGKDIFTPDHHD